MAKGIRMSYDGLVNMSDRIRVLTVLRSTAPAPLGVRKVHKIVYNIASIFNFGLALRAGLGSILRSKTPF